MVTKQGSICVLRLFSELILWLVTDKKQQSSNDLSARDNSRHDSNFKWNRETPHYSKKRARGVAHHQNGSQKQQQQSHFRCLPAPRPALLRLGKKIGTAAQLRVVKKGSVPRPDDLSVFQQESHFMFSSGVWKEAVRWLWAFPHAVLIIAGQSLWCHLEPGTILNCAELESQKQRLLFWAFSWKIGSKKWRRAMKTPPSVPEMEPADAIMLPKPPSKKWVTFDDLIGKEKWDLHP